MTPPNKKKVNPWCRQFEKKFKYIQEFFMTNEFLNHDNRTSNYLSNKTTIFDKKMNMCVYI